MRADTEKTEGSKSSDGGGGASDGNDTAADGIYPCAKCKPAANRYANADD